MCVYIGIEDVAANALLELLELKNCRFVKFSALGEYGNFVVNLYSSKNKETAIFILSRERRDMFFEDYSAYFEPLRENDDDGAIVGVQLREGVGRDELLRFFRNNMAIHLIDAFLDKKAINILLNKAA